MRSRQAARGDAGHVAAIDRTQQAAGGLDDRIFEIKTQAKTLDQLDHKLVELTDYLINKQPKPTLPNDPISAESTNLAANSTARSRSGSAAKAKHDTKVAPVLQPELIRS